MNIVLIGIQGSGKGTLVLELQKHFNISLISVGQLLREEIATGSERGKKIKERIDKGFLADIDIVMDIIQNKLSTTSAEFTVFDGFPRDTEQADRLDKIANVDLAIYLNLDKAVAVERIVNRLTCSKCGFITTKQEAVDNKCPKCDGVLATRSDDIVEAVNKRFELYEKETYPLLERYKARGVVVEIDANRTPQEVLESVLKVIK